MKAKLVRPTSDVTRPSVLDTSLLAMAYEKESSQHKVILLRRLRELFARIDAAFEQGDYRTAHSSNQQVADILRQVSQFRDTGVRVGAADSAESTEFETQLTKQSA